MTRTGYMATLAALIALSGPIGARAQDEAGRGGEENGMAGMAGRFDAADTDGDGKLSRDEMVARMTARAERMIAQNDADGDGMLSMEELRAGRGGGMFGRLDADGDGALSPAEYAEMRKMHEKHHGKHGAKHGGKHGAKHGGKHAGKHAGKHHDESGQGDRERHGQSGEPMQQGSVVIHHHYYYGD